MNLPNRLTILRLCLVPLFVWFFFKPPGGWYLAPAVLLLLSGLTDVLDGFIARKYHLVTQLGQFLDPLADKITILAVVACLSLRHPPVRILLVFYLVKELTLGSVGLALLKSWRNSPPAKWYGKMATVTLYLLFFLLLIRPDFPQEWIYPLMAVPAVFMILSLIFYLKEITKRNNRL